MDCAQLAAAIEKVAAELASAQEAPPETLSLFETILEGIKPLLWPAGVAVIVFLLLFVLHRVVEKRSAASHRRFGHQIMMVSLSLLGLLVVLLVIPETLFPRGDLLTVAGILLSATLALSSTTLLGNAMAGVMLKSVRSFRSGDFVRVGDHYGRVSGRGFTPRSRPRIAT
jgi:small-conductance mechanosensitive channel